MMTLKQFGELNKKYRVICEYDDNLVLRDKESFIIPILNNKGYCYWNGEDKLSMICFKSPKNNIDMLKEKYNIALDVFGEYSEYYIEFNPKDIDKVAECFEFREAPKRPVNPLSEDNINLWLRVMQNISPRYKDILKKRLGK